jgi:hypothetical protein
MTLAPQTNFTTLTEAEKNSKLWQLATHKGQCTLWRRGQKERVKFRVKDFEKENSKLILHVEQGSPTHGSDILGSFELKNVSFFFKSKIIVSSPNTLVIDTSGEFFKSERRQNYRLLTYPIYDIDAYFSLPVDYQGGKVVDIRNKTSQTGLFRSFLKLVEPEASEKLGNRLRLRVQDLSVTGLSIHIGEIELPFFRTGEIIKDLEIDVAGEMFAIPLVKVVYVVDQIGHLESHQKKFKVGLRFEKLSQELDLRLGKKINELLRQVDANHEFEDFLK